MSSGDEHMEQAIAHYVGGLTQPNGAQWRHYRVEGGPLAEHGHVIVSACDTFDRGPETYIFAADAAGEVTGWGELDGSLTGAMDHERALLGAGYNVWEARAAE